MKGTSTHALVGAYIRVGRSSKGGPIYRVKRYSTDTKRFTTENMANGIVSDILGVELEKGIEDHIVHVIGRAKRDS